MKLSVPFIPEKTYIDFLRNQGDTIASVYFPLLSGPVLDARMRFQTVTDLDLADGLAKISPARKYCLFNSRFIHPDLYTDRLFLKKTLEKLAYLTDHAGLTGIVFSDAYLLNALSADGHEIVSRLEAVPGINLMIDTPEKAVSFIRFVEQTGFRLPGKIILDRSLNRDMDQLKKICRTLKKTSPEINIEIIANEGCIYHCPFKLTHDSHISLSNTGLHRDKNFQMNRFLGCHPFFFTSPDAFFKSPFIRPEDVVHYENLADTLKICGRTLGVSFLTRCIRAYLNKSHDGNLLDLMDASHWLGDHIHIENRQLDPGFFKMLTGCTKDCKKCRLCRDLYQKAAQTKPLTIKHYKDYL